MGAGGSSGGASGGGGGYSGGGLANTGGTGYGGNVGAQGTAGEKSGGAGGSGLAGYGGGGMAGVAGSGWNGSGGGAGSAGSGSPAGFMHGESTGPVSSPNSMPAYSHGELTGTGFQGYNSSVSPGGTGYGGDLGGYGTAGEMSGGAGGAGMAGYGGGGIAGVQGSGFGGPNGSAGRAAGFGGPMGVSAASRAPVGFSQSLPTQTYGFGVAPVQPGTPVHRPGMFPSTRPGDQTMVRDPRSIAGGYVAGGKGPFGTSFGGIGYNRNPGIGDTGIMHNAPSPGNMGNQTGNAPGSGSTGGPTRGDKGNMSPGSRGGFAH